MTVAEIMEALENLPRDEELFVRVIDSDGEPMFLLVASVAIDPDGIMIEGGDEVEFK
jgi:hypothetical protein